ncbi:MAG: hypothetical protein FJ009_06145 [Chloroflexi bacterium]|nr:hypothetical protein [Chloroflexota bacterium]
MAYKFAGPDKCRMCSQPIEQSDRGGRRKKYCSNRCKMRARQQRARTAMWASYAPLEKALKKKRK